MDILSFTDAAQWDTWLAAHYEQPDGVWVKVRKAASGQPAITVAEAGDVALCYGWIDSVRRSYDDDHFLQKYSRRRPGGSWSRVNVERAERLTAAGRMRAGGLAEIAAARADGRWDAAYAPQRDATVPDDLAAALAADEVAGAAFQRLGKTGRYLAMLPLLKAANPKTRAARLGKLMADLVSAADPPAPRT